MLFSAVSLWEIAIKAGLGRPDFACDPKPILQAALETGFVALPNFRPTTAIPAIVSSSPRR